MYNHIKKLSFALLLIAATTSMTFTGCKKKDSSSSSSSTTNNTNNGCGDGTLCGKLDNTDFVSDGAGTAASTVSYGSYTSMTVAATKSSKDEIGITITTTPAAGQTYSTSKSNAVFTYSNMSTGDSWSTDGTTAHSGTVTITKYDATANLVSGTFSFTAASQQNSTTHSFTNGAFTNVKLMH